LRRGNAYRSRQPNVEPLTPAVPVGMTRPSSLLAPLVHSSALSASDTAPAAPAGSRRSSRVNFGVPWQPEADSRGPANGLAVGGRGRL
jgi:hypothetical protein